MYDNDDKNKNEIPILIKLLAGNDIAIANRSILEMAIKDTLSIKFQLGNE